MTARREPDGRHELLEERDFVARYLMALATSVLAVAISGVVASLTGDAPLYAPLLGAVALVAWYGGTGPAVAAVALSWIGTLWLAVEPRGEIALNSSGELVRAGIALAIAFVIVAVAQALRLGRRRAGAVAATAEADLAGLQALNEVAAALAASVSSADVSRALTEEGARLLGADGAVVGLVEGDDVVFAHPTGIAEETSLPSSRVPLARATVLSRAVREGTSVLVAGRAELAASYPDTAAMLPTARGVIAVPLRSAGEVMGVLGFAFEGEGAPGEEEVAYAGTIARLAEQALDRAHLYERERSTRQALDRILLVAPRFRAESAAGTARAVCQEARTSFGADFSLLWRVRGEELELVAVDPPQAELEGGFWPLASFPDLASAMRSLGVSFVPDVLEEARGPGLELNRALGIRSSLRTPIVLSGQAQLVLSLSWQQVVSEPDRTTVAIVRRFADQAALALEENERRRAERDAARRAEDMRRLQSLTAALSNALTRADVAEVAIEHLRAAAGADGAAVAVIFEERQALRLLAFAGYEDDALAGWAESARDEATPVTDVLERGEPVLHSSRAALRAAYPGLRPEDAPDGYESLLLVPLVVGRRPSGLLALSWAEPHELTEDELGYVRSMASQVAQALDRATHFESEQTIAETLQRSVLPATLPRLDGVQLAARYLPGSAELDVGGDWFDAVPLPDGRIGLVVGDVVGKGVFAAASMGQLRNALRAFSVDRLKPATVLARLNRLAEDVLDTTFATVVYLVVDPDTRVCRLSSAGHPPPVARYPDGRVELLEGGRGLPLGTGLDVRYRQEALELPAGTSLLLYSDGLVERRGKSIDDGLRELCEAVRAGPSAPEAMLEHVLEQMVGEQERGDDIALLTARLLPVAPRELQLTISSDVSSLELVRDALRVWLGGTELQRSEAEDVVLAAWEACANAREHARDAVDDSIHVRATVRGATVRIVVEDSGKWKTPSDSSERGLGLRLMRSVMSSVDVAVGDAGTRVTIEKTPAGARTS